MRISAFERFWDTHAEPLLSFLLYRTGDAALAEDVLADAFERALRARRRFDPRRGSEKTWLYAIALNCLRDHQRRRTAEDRALERLEAQVVYASSATAGAQLGQVEDRDALEQALGTLSAEEQEAIALRFGSDLTVPDIARVLGVPLATAEGRVYRSLRKLRDAMS